jgi:hypothetical protein
MNVHRLGIFRNVLIFAETISTADDSDCRAPSSFITPAHNSGGFSAPPITQPTTPKTSPQTGRTTPPQQQPRAVPVPRAPPFFQPPELPPHFEKLPPAEKGRNGKFTRTKRSDGEPFERICVLMPPELVEAVLEIAEDAELPASTIWRRAVILGFEAARAEAGSGIDLSRE